MHDLTPSPTLLFAIGNESRGDDALAPLLLRRLSEWLTAEGLAGKYELLEDFQLQVEHATDIEGRKLVLFIDAGLDTPAPYSFYRIKNDDGRTLFSHAITPEAVLATFKNIYQQDPPPAFVLCVRGEQFELGAPPTPDAVRHMELAFKLLLELSRTANESAWNDQCIAKLSGAPQLN